MLPLPKTDGGPSMSPDVNASEIMQGMIMNDDDKEWYAMLSKQLSKDFLKPKRSVEPTDRGMNSVNSGLDISLRGCLLSEKLVTEPDDLEGKRKRRKKKKTDEFNAMATGNVSGYTLPLGASNQNKKARRKNAKVNAKAFGGGKVVGKL